MMDAEAKCGKRANSGEGKANFIIGKFSKLHGSPSRNRSVVEEPKDSEIP